ncbi:MAG: glycosyltransferase family 4 protein [Melioribacteraceae bacterium]|nr:glycosyltransferase family 4 protein [Melioribacteraceae bacterium]
MKILQVNNYARVVGGADSVFINTIKLLTDRNHEIIPFSSNPAEETFERYAEYFIDSPQAYSNNNYFSGIVNKFRKFYSKSAADSLAKLLIDFNPQIAHIHNIHGVITFSILPVLKRFGIPVVATIHGFKNLCPAYMFLDGKGKICERCAGKHYFNVVLRNCSNESVIKDSLLMFDSYFRDLIFPIDEFVDHYVFVSEFTRQKYCSYRPEVKEKSSVIYNFVDNNDYVNVRGDYFLYAGRLDKEKGLATLLSAFRDLPDQKLIIAGTGSMMDFLRNQKTHNVEIAGYKKGEELKELIGSAKFLILPSECYESNPMVILEAFSLGTPVIGSNLGGIAEIVKEGVNGFLFEPKNVQVLKSVVSKCDNIQNEDYTTMCRNARDYQRSEFSVGRHYEKLLKVYRQLV